jgi:molybdenum cofactor synthesis domain-containing protein
MPTVAVLVIGNEILTGKFADENGPYLIKRLRALGADLRRMVTLVDDEAGIAAEVAACASAFDHVITSGGVGPTHDDVTVDGVARAFGLPLDDNADLLALIRRYGLREDAATLRMAKVPRGAELVWSADLAYPALVVRNVLVLPGVPKLFRVKFEALAQRFAGEQVGTARLYVTEQEWDIAARLTALAAEHPAVAIGSYPRFGEGPYHVILTLESRDPVALEAARVALASAFATVVP